MNFIVKFFKLYFKFWKIVFSPLIIVWKILKFPFSKSKKELVKEYEEMDKKVESMLRSGQRISNSDWNFVRGNPHGSNIKYQVGSELYKLYINIESKYHKEREDQINKNKDEKKKKLIEKYGEINALKILKKELWVGMDINHVYEVKGSHNKRVDNVINKVEKTILYFEKHKNRLGNDAYDFEITLENGKVVGWKNRANVATRNL